MAEEKMCVDAEEVARDWGEQFPNAIIVSGKVSRAYYNRCCLADVGRKKGSG